MRGRAHLVGDVGPHAPDHWEGGLGGPDIHAMGWIRTDSDQDREEATRIVRAEMEATGGVEICFVQDTMALAHQNGIGSEGEHFGFADPISQPPIEGADTPSYPGDGVLEPDGTWRPLKPGEFLLGYEDEVGPEGTQTPQPLELRLNGTYMVFRKLYQDAAAFRRYLVIAAEALYGSDDHNHQELVAAKIMGRWRSGCPIDLSPDKDDPAIAADPQRRNNFTYAGDEQGLRCPIGAHLRRSNPRATPLKRATAVRRHRLIRRGVEYGPHLPDGVIEDDGVDRGLINLFIQADIERQFEFVQKEWMKGGEFIGLDPNEQDPINGVGGEGSQMVVPGAKRPFLFDLPTFVKVKAGEYLFVPGLNALKGIIENKF
jgi:Dyp-type peroxidase family